MNFPNQCEPDLHDSATLNPYSISQQLPQTYFQTLTDDIIGQKFKKCQQNIDMFFSFAGVIYDLVNKKNHFNVFTIKEITQYLTQLHTSEKIIKLINLEELRMQQLIDQINPDEIYYMLPLSEQLLEKTHDIRHIQNKIKTAFMMMKTRANILIDKWVHNYKFQIAEQIKDLSYTNAYKVIKFKKIESDDINTVTTQFLSSYDIIYSCHINDMLKIDKNMRARHKILTIFLSLVLYSLNLLSSHHQYPLIIYNIVKMFPVYESYHQERLIIKEKILIDYFNTQKTLFENDIVKHMQTKHSRIKTITIKSLSNISYVNLLPYKIPLFSNSTSCNWITFLEKLSEQISIQQIYFNSLFFNLSSISHAYSLSKKNTFIKQYLHILPNLHTFSDNSATPQKRTASTAFDDYENIDEDIKIAEFTMNYFL
jgi:hypothetical protein